AIRLPLSQPLVARPVPSALALDYPELRAVQSRRSLLRAFRCTWLLQAAVPVVADNRPEHSTPTNDYRVDIQLFRQCGAHRPPPLHLSRPLGQPAAAPAPPVPVARRPPRLGFRQFPAASR